MTKARRRKVAMDIPPTPETDRERIAQIAAELRKNGEPVTVKAIFAMFRWETGKPPDSAEVSEEVAR